MIEALIISNVLLWIGLVASIVLLIGLARQIGLLHERSAPLGAMMTDKGPDVGDAAPAFTLKDQNERAVSIGGVQASGMDQLLLFVSPTCPMCEKLLPVAKSLVRDEKLRLVLISDGDPADHERYLKSHDLTGIPYVRSAEVGMRYQVGRVPHAVIIDGDGIIRSKGLVNTREHLESLVESRRTGHASIQAFLRSTGQMPTPKVEPEAQLLH
ncbi:methylamine dehydrogenase accessory protein MauD [Indioceanicola profundi]|uniref:methylamine dehydrogenase accessory protein MauD n=1 Tax=Indioceanicola profundi TaxID=2220096 RepID=UPI0019699478|nr:methylamine dehydrogenase accessory protein MauD [Indioceanicola profundi]